MAKKTKLPVSNISNAVPYKETKADEAREKRWRAEEDLRTLQRAQEISQDKERTKAAQMLAKEQKAALEKICK